MQNFTEELEPKILVSASRLLKHVSEDYKSDAALQTHLVFTPVHPRVSVSHTWSRTFFIFHIVYWR